MLFSPVDEVHSDYFHNLGGHCFYIEFSPFALERAREHSLRLDEPAEFRGGALTLISTRLYREFCETDEVSPLVVEGLAFEMMAEVSRQRNIRLECTPPYWLRQTKDMLHARFAETLTLTEIALLMGVHPVHLARVFRQFYNCSIGEYVRNLRVENASFQLTMSDKTLAEIALTVGFADQAHFTRTFKNQTGLTPAQFRNTFSLR